MTRGGARPNAGRKTGAATKKTADIANKAVAEGITPLEYLLSVMRDVGNEQRERAAAAVAAAPYVHAKLSSIDATITGANGGPLEHSIKVSFVDGPG